MEVKDISIDPYKSPTAKSERYAGPPVITSSKPIKIPNTTDSSSDDSEVIDINESYGNLVPDSPTDSSRSPCSTKLWGKHFHKHITNQGKGSEASKAGKYSLTRHVLPRKLPLDWRNKILLGSGSSSRRSVLKHLGWEFRQISPDIDEKAIRSDDPLELPLLIATAKANAIIEKLKADNDMNEWLIITADQIVLCNDQIREKPMDEVQAIEYLSSYSNHHVSTISAVVCTYYPSMRQAKNVDEATIHWGTISSAIVSKVVLKGDVFNSAGGFCIEDADLNPCIKFIEGTVDSIFGLPVDMTIHMMNDVVRPAVEDNEHV